ncbi:hypothetical protein D1007_20543 [Hordeum vulgare]|nr:hypothetical protein D1007_20543 [Hordeum vulgare]
MAEPFPGYEAAANGFGQRSLHELEAHALHEPNYPVPPDMRVSGTSRLSVGGVPVPPPSSIAECRGEMTRIQASMLEYAR